MKDYAKKKELLIKELKELRGRFVEMEALKTRCSLAEHETKEVEKKLIKNERFLNNILDSIQDGISIVDEDLNVLYVNPAMQERYPHRRPVPGRKCYEAFHNRKEPCSTCPGIQTFTTGKQTLETLPFTKPNGVRGWLELFTFPLRDSATSKVTRVIEYARDITERIRARRELLDEKNKLEAIIAGIGDGISIQDTDFKILYQNQVHKDFLGSHMGEHCYRAYKQKDDTCPGCPLSLSFKDGNIHRAESTIYVGDNISHLEITASPLRDSSGEITAGIEVVRDVTARKRAGKERKRLQIQLIQAQKLESIGRLAGGVAHDFNNILSAILGYCDLALLDISEESPLRETLSIIRDSGEKAAALTRQLLAFSRKQVLDIKLVNLNTIVTNMAKMLKRLISEDILFELQTRTSTINVMTDASQIEQVLMNLAVNARDAMPSGGRLLIETDEVVLDEAYAKHHEGAKPGSYAMLSVIDTGQGMRPEVQENIFEPFFTTKGREKGTGLGLATVYGIVTQHNGHITVKSEPGKGTTFKVFLPLAQADAQEKNKEKACNIQQGTETVLVVDDDPFIRRLVVDIIEPLGYHPVGASHGKEALTLCSQYSGKIDLLLTDVVMPEMNGKKLADAFLTRHPKAKVIFMSGYTDDTIAQQRVRSPGTGFIQKPLVPEKLANQMREVLDENFPG